MTVEYPQVAIDVWTPLPPARVWQPLTVLFMTAQGNVQRFVIAGWNGRQLQESRIVDAPYGALRTLTADIVEAYTTDIAYESLIRSVGIQTDIGVVTD